MMLKADQMPTELLDLPDQNTILYLLGGIYGIGDKIASKHKRPPPIPM